MFKKGQLLFSRMLKQQNKTGCKHKAKFILHFFVSFIITVSYTQGRGSLLEFFSYVFSLDK